MDFEITVDGELRAYYGKGGDVVIPEGVKFIASDGVFSSKSRIKSIYLPKSFMGHIYEPYKKGYIFEWSEKDGRVISSYLDEGISNLRASNKTLYAYYCHVQLPYLISYKVHEENPVYAERDGILYSKDMSCLLGVPSKSSANIVFEGADCNINYAAIAYLKSKLIKAEYHGDFLSTKTVYSANGLNDRVVLLYLPNVTRCDKYLRQKEVYEDVPRTFLIAPKLSLDGLQNYVGREVAAGYCFEPDLFDEVQALKCQTFLATEEIFLYKYARTSKISQILDGYKSVWDRWLLKDRPIKCEEEACRYLFDAVIYGTDEQVKDTLELDYDFWGRHQEYGHRTHYNGAQILAIACRYGGVNKLTALLDCDKFCDAKTADDPLTSIEFFIKERYYLFCSGYPHFCSDHLDIKLPLSVNEEIRDRSPLSEEQRIECIKILTERGIINQEQQNAMCFFALMMGDCKISSYLRGKGAVFTDFYSGVDNFIPYYDYQSAINHSIKSQNKGITTLSKYLREDNGKIRLSQSVLKNLLLENADLLFEIIDCVEIAPGVMAELIEKCISNNLGEPLTEFIKLGKIKTKASLEKYIAKAIELEAREITALLLDYKNDTFGTKRKTKRSSMIL